MTIDKFAAKCKTAEEKGSTFAASEEKRQRGGRGEKNQLQITFCNDLIRDKANSKLVDKKGDKTCPWRIGSASSSVARRVITISHVSVSAAVPSKKRKAVSVIRVTSTVHY